MRRARNSKTAGAGGSTTQQEIQAAGVPPRVLSPEESEDFIRMPRGKHKGQDVETVFRIDTDCAIGSASTSETETSCRNASCARSFGAHGPVAGSHRSRQGTEQHVCAEHSGP